MNGVSYYNKHVSNANISIQENMPLINYVERYTNINFNSLSELEQNYIKENINLDNCYITSISKLKSGKLISLVIPDIKDNYKLVNSYDIYYLVKWKKTNGNYYCTINSHKPSLWRNGIECSYFANKEDYMGYKNGMGCELVDIFELSVLTGTKEAIDNSIYIKSQDVITDENIIDTSIFFKKEDV